MIVHKARVNVSGCPSRNLTATSGCPAHRIICFIRTSRQGLLSTIGPIRQRTQSRTVHRRNGSVSAGDTGCASRETRARWPPDPHLTQPSLPERTHFWPGQLPASKTDGAKCRYGYASGRKFHPSMAVVGPLPGKEASTGTGGRRPTMELSTHHVTRFAAGTAVPAGSATLRRRAMN